jgi:DNA polymerase-3 subunit beta
MAILEHLLFEVADGVMRVTGFNLEMRITVETPVEASGAFSWTMPATRIVSLAGSWLANKAVQINIDGLQAIARCGRSQAKMTSFSPADFPLLELESVDLTVCAPTGWASLMRSVANCMAKDDVRYVLNGLALEVHFDCLKAIATNGHICATNRLMIDGPEEIKKAVIPARSVAAILGIFQDAPIEMVFRNEGNAIVFRQGGIEASTQLVAGAFPDVSRVVPDTVFGSIVPNRQDLMLALKRLHLLDGSKPVRGRVIDGAWELLGKANQDEGNEVVALHNKDGDVQDFGLYPRMLASMIADIKDEEVRFEFSNDNHKPLKIVAGDYLGLLMPVIL